jgi:hypothetical protein
MNKLQFVCTGLLLLLLSTGVKAQTKTGADYFAGKWDMLIKGTPQGDSKLFFVLDKKDTTLAGVVQDSTGAEMTKITKIELKSSEATVYFVAQGYDVSVVMTKKDDDHVTGSLLAMFDVEGVRVKTTKYASTGKVVVPQAVNLQAVNPQAASPAPATTER